MKATSKLKEGLEERINERVKKFKKREGHHYFLSNIAYPETEKQRIRYQLAKSTKELEKYMPAIKKLVKHVKAYVPHIWEQNAITAVYILLGKTYVNLETIISLAKDGRNVEIIELARSGHESLDLAFLFLEEGQEERLKNWFKGKIIDNKTAREAFHKVLNKELSSPNPVYDAKTDVYGIYSLYTHSSYAALLDTIDVFHEDFDYEGLSGLHYTLEYFDSIIKQLMVSLLLELKNVFIKSNDLENISAVDQLLESMGNYKASQEEITNILKKYQKE